MNILIIDDINTVCQSARDTIFHLSSSKNTVYIYVYDVELSLEKNVIKIYNEISKNNINFIALDRGYSKIYEDIDNNIYSSHDKKYILRKQTADNLLKELKIIFDSKINKYKLPLLDYILIYTYDPFNPAINTELYELKKEINTLSKEIIAIETSNIFNKPENSLIYPNFIVSSEQIRRYFVQSKKIKLIKNIYLYFRGKIELLNKKRKLGLKTTFSEYGDLIGHIIYDFACNSKLDRYSYGYDNNIIFSNFLSIINNGIEGYNLDLKLSSISYLSNRNNKEEYLVDVPYKEYYRELNENLNENYISIFKDTDGLYKSDQWVYFSYNFIDKNRVVQIYKLESSEKSKNEILKTWLPYLHSGIFHDKKAWKTKQIINLPFSKSKKINLFFYYTRLDIGNVSGHINFTLYNENNYLINDNDIETYIKKVKDNIFPLIKSKISEILIPELSKDLQSQATRAAISQVMARNTSHNMGAHVMNKLIGELRELNILNFEDKDNQNYKSTIELEDIHKGVIEKLEKNSWYKDADNHLKIEAEKNEIILEQISIFNNYLKCRMDYLADISFGTPLMQTNKYAYKDLFKELDKVRLLLEHISGLSDFNYEIKFKKNGEELNDENDILVAIPNDILGTQAFYNILENIIRNTAKHAKKEPKIDENGKSLAITYKFTVNFIDEPENGNAEQSDILKDFIAVEVYDDIDVLGNVTNDQIVEYRKVTNEELKSTIDWLVFNQNIKLNDDILQESSTLRSNSLGLIEMDASAAYLRKRDVNKINDVKYDILHDKSWKNKEEYKYFLKAIKKEEKLGNEPKNYLGYRFFLLRPELVIIVVNDDREISNIDELRKNGITIITKEKFKEQLQSGKVYNHEFVLHTDMDSETITIDHLEIEILEHYKTSLPIRILKINVDVLKNKLNEKQTLDKKLSNIFEEFCWEEWGCKLKTIYNINDKIKIDNSGRCTVKECSCTKNGEFNAIILDHGKKFWNDSRYCKKVDYLDDLSTKAYEKLPRLNTKLEKDEASYYLKELKLDNNINKLQRHKLCESIISKILIIDERIQNQINKVYYQKVSDLIEDSYIILNHEVYRKSRIVIPDTYSESPFFKTSENIEEYRFNLSANDMSEDYGNALKKYVEYYKDTLKKTDFILIHFSILERICKSGGNDKTKEINRFLESIASPGCAQIVITSGRGTLKGLTSKVRFVNLSPVITSFVEIRSKYYGNYLLNSSRKNNSIK